MEEIKIQRKESSIFIDIPIVNTFHKEISVYVGSNPTVKYKIDYGTDDGKSTFTEITRYIGRELKEYEEIRDVDNQVIRKERHYYSSSKSGKYIDVFTWIDTENRFERKTYFQRRWWSLFWGEIVPHEGPII